MVVRKKYEKQHYSTALHISTSSRRLECTSATERIPYTVPTSSSSALNQWCALVVVVWGWCCNYRAE